MAEKNDKGKKQKPEAGNDGPVLREIVGVVGDVRHDATSRDLDPVTICRQPGFRERAACIQSFALKWNH